MTATGLAPAAGAVASDLARPHHDGSDAYVLDVPDELGGDAVVRLRVPRGSEVDGVALRYVRDGEATVVKATVDEESEHETWWRATFPVGNPDTLYRWLVSGPTGRSWLNGCGVADHDVPDSDDFVLSVDRGGPDWHLESVVYEIFPDRFAASGRRVDPPSWAVRRGWEELPTGPGPAFATEWFGGDLAGIEQRLGHIESLGASAIYLTPIFPAGSVHRYDATTFDRIDPLLGGDEALASLVATCHERGIRVLGDLTTNHTGVRHEWFERARTDGTSAEHSFYYFDDSPLGYAAWLGVPHLPKLDWRSPGLRHRMGGAARRWLEPPFGLDGWRIDVANMTGRYRDIDVNHEAAASVRDHVESARPDAVLVAENGHDFRRDLHAGGWHGVMNYAGFLRPVWWWLRSDEYADEPFAGSPVLRLDGDRAVATMRAFRAGTSWPSVLHSWALLDSHDSPRFRTVAGSRDRQLVGVGLQMTTPGVPMVFAGDELGLEGRFGEDARRTMPWAAESSWDQVLLAEYRHLIALRRSSAALARGGIRYAFVDEDVIAYVREAPGDRVLCLASRAGHAPVRLPLSLLACAELEALVGAEAGYENGSALLPADGPEFHAWRLIDDKGVSRRG